MILIAVNAIGNHGLPITAGNRGKNRLFFTVYRGKQKTINRKVEVFFQLSLQNYGWGRALDPTPPLPNHPKLPL